MTVYDTVLENIAEPFYAATFIISIWRYPKYYNTPLKYFPVIVIYTLLNEILGLLIGKYTDTFSLSVTNFYSNYNIVLYNIFNIIYFLYFYTLFRKYIKNILYKKLIYYGILIFTVTSIVNMFIQNIFRESLLFTFVFGSIMLILIVLTYLNQIDWHENKLDPTNNILFWIGWGLLVFYSGYIPIKLSNHFRVISDIDNYIWVRRLHLALIGVMYICFIVGFLKMKRKLIKD
tara:strand:+ start:141 stop:836 length:696 start_codon:yes stop_codon:yes gene_type:complete